MRRLYNHKSRQNLRTEFVQSTRDYHKFFFPDFGLRAYAVRLEALRVLGSRNLKEPERGESRNLSPASSM